MTKLFRRVPLAFLALATSGVAQSLPADTGPAAPGVGFSLPRVGGSLTYGVNASEVLSTGFYNSGTSYSTNISGDAAYISKSQSHPFSAIYNGGVLLANSGQPTTFFQSLSFSQVLTTKHWNFALADSVSFLPQSPTGGLSGVPGTGDLGVDPVAVLTSYGPRVSNSLSGTASRQINGRFSTQVTGMYAIQRFIGDNSDLALNSTTEGGSVGLSYRASARDTFTGNYNYSNFTYSGNTYSFQAQGATVSYSRQWSPRFVTDVYAGPQIISGSSEAINGTAVTVAAGASASYLSRSTSYSVTYSRGANNGSGVIPGSFSDNVTAAAHRQLGREWLVSGDVGYARTSSLPNSTLNQFNSKGVFMSVQGSRRLGRYFSGFGSYTVEDQSVSIPTGSAAPQNAFSGVFQVVSLGISFSPRPVLLGR